MGAELPLYALILFGITAIYVVANLLVNPAKCRQPPKKKSRVMLPTIVETEVRHHVHHHPLHTAIEASKAALAKLREPR